MNTIRHIIIPLIAWALLCQPTRAQQPTFPLPTIPETLTTTEQCLQYLLMHYWELYDFDDTTATNQLVWEQGFVNFIDIMPVADSMLCEQSMALYVEKALLTDQRIQRFDYLADHYLADRHSPMRNDIIYAHLLRQAVAFYAKPQHKKTHAARLQRARFMLENIDKNQVGTVASDFKFKVDGKGKQHLRDIKSPITIIMFFDPQCDDCHRAMRQMEDSPLFANPDINILRIQPSQVKRQYYVTVTPSFYLLDQDKHVLLKDVDLNTLSNTLPLYLPSSHPQE